MEEYAIILAGFVAIEATFRRLEGWAVHHRGRVMQIRHLSLVAWLIHPACIDAAAKLCEHVVTSWIVRLVG